MTSAYSLVKRALDVTCSAGALVMASPLLVAVSCAIRATMGRPVLFHQRRAGLHGVPFVLLKFRTMRPPGGEGQDRIDRDGERLTPLGRFLRATSLDELPTLFNVLQGDMSLVGPRPLLLQYLERYSPEQARRHVVKPGVTGWSQVNGRNDLPWADKLAKDVWYVDHRSLSLDLRIIVKTAGQVLRREGVIRTGTATTVEFMGDDDASAKAR